jgi:hypothetical protein
MAFSAALAFYPVNNKPFIYILQAAVSYLFSNKLYLFKLMPKKLENNNISNIKNSAGGIYVPKLSDSKLKDLVWSLDINETTKDNEPQ